jgi:hypothetical protein
LVNRADVVERKVDLLPVDERFSENNRTSSRSSKENRKKKKNKKK